MERRSVLKWLAGLTAGILLSSQTNAQKPTPKTDRLGKLLPLRTLGRTGEAVTMLGVGGWHLGSLNERDAQATIEIALQGGVRFFDTAQMYQSGGSETRMGKLVTYSYADTEVYSVGFSPTPAIASDTR
ncbi:MAG: aldo/keto reductase [Prochloraceae cyanobacterium]|nr:aldo/keto reductase [Prochloraceae cyanobacterium]